MHNSPVSPAWLALIFVSIIVGAASARAAESPADAAAAAAPSPSADLPTVVVAPRPVHTVPDQDPVPPPPVTLKSRDGSFVALHAPAPPIVRWRPAPAPVVLISGAARATDGASLNVHGRSVHLFGVRLPPSGDRCAGGATAPRACSEVARDALATRLRIDADVSCRVPPGQRSPVAGAVCHDVTGVDLGEFLVAQGLALADPSQSYEYVGAESAARASRRGLWNYR